MKRALYVTVSAVVLYLIGTSAVLSASEEVGTAAGAEASAVSRGNSTAVGLGALGALIGIFIATSGGGDGSTGAASNTTTGTTR
ncbi:exopolysaccharide production protein YjbE [Enterobacteriaceae bacterium LUAb1]